MNDFFTVLNGQEKIKEQFHKLLASDRVPHTLLLAGENQQVLREIAIAMASSIIGRQAFSPDGISYISSMGAKSPKKNKTEEGAPIYMDKGEVCWIRPMTSTGLKIMQWQLLLNEYLSTASEEPRVILIEDIQTAREDFSNALLKSIEEPPSHVYFILMTTSKSTLLPTILSRVMTIPVIENTPLYQEEGLEKAKEFLRILCESRISYTECVLYVAPFSKEEWMVFLEAFRVLLREIEVVRVGGNKELLFAPANQYDYANFVASYTSKKTSAIIEELIVAEEALRLHIRPNLVADGLVLALRRILKEEP